jgi:protease PrsW
VNHSLIVSAPLGILPVLVFLVALQYLDSFKLVRLRLILWMIVAGGALAAMSYYANGSLRSMLGLEFMTYARYVAPIVEEMFKASVLFYLVKTHRVGFLVDGAILGFAIGAGFAVCENFYYLYVIHDGSIGVWIVRGFGTAIMHGGVTAIFAIITLALMEKHESSSVISFLPGWILAMVIHSVYNHFFLSPIFSAIAIFLLLPPFMYLVFEKSARSVHEWLELDFDADADLILQLNSGEFEETHVGKYLQELRQRFEGLIIVDMLCYLRLYTELSMRAKGAMMMRQHGMEMPYDESVEAKFKEMQFLEKSIGRTGLFAIEPFLEINRRDLWHLNALQESH